MKVLLLASALTVLWTGCRLALLKHSGIPQPAHHDEFSYLLGADTFAHGRVANPPHPLARFFESPHVLARPVYASKYPPGQALFLALGQRLFGSPFYGVVIGNALMVFTFCVMLCAWVRLPWAVAVAAALACSLIPPMYWTDSYWGGAVAASGAALVLIAVGYSRIRQAAALGTVFALGAVLLFFTRPFEGGVLILAVFIVFGKELWQRRRWAAVLAALPVIALGVGFSAYMNKATTGSYLKLPYLLHDRQYNVTPPFWFLPLRPEPAYSHPRLASQHGNSGWEQEDYRHQHPWPLGVVVGFLFSLETFFKTFKIYGVSGLLSGWLALLILFAWRDPLSRRVGIVVGICLLAMTFETWHFPHYSAPALAALSILVAAGAEQCWKFRPPIGPGLTVFVLIFSVVSSVSTLAATRERSWTNDRADLMARLSKLAVPQLVIVHYPSPGWKVDEEWVYNSSNIDAQKVVFAHDLGEKENTLLRDYYPDRQASLLTLNDSGYTLTPYKATAGVPTASPGR